MTKAAAASRQFSNGRSMVECFGGAGWGASPEDLERYLLWLRPQWHHAISFSISALIPPRQAPRSLTGRHPSRCTAG